MLREEHFMGRCFRCDCGAFAKLFSYDNPAARLLKVRVICHSCNRYAELQFSKQMVMELPSNKALQYVLEDLERKFRSEYFDCDKKIDEYWASLEEEVEVKSKSNVEEFLEKEIRKLMEQQRDKGCNYDYISSRLPPGRKYPVY